MSERKHIGARCRDCAFYNRHERTCECDDWQSIPRKPQQFACSDFEPRDDEEEGGES